MVIGRKSVGAFAVRARPRVVQLVVSWLSSRVVQLVACGVKLQPISFHPVSALYVAEYTGGSCGWEFEGGGWGTCGHGGVEEHPCAHYNRQAPA